MSATTSSDPDMPSDVRPVVRLAGQSNVGVWVFVAALILGGWLVFSMLSDRRAGVTAPRTAAIPGSELGMIGSPPPLALPQDRAWIYDDGPRYPVSLQRARPAPLPPVLSSPSRRSAVAPVRTASVPPQTTYLPAPVRQIEALPPYGDIRELPASATAPAAVESSDRIRAGRLASPASTVPQGTVIPAVLETALDSTRPGAARALVQRNVYGFDGSRVLIPRGSRLYGEYEADLGDGQKRAAVRWTRLLRPDGVTVALDSPASDPLGRAGIKGRVDSKFLQRFGGALLQSVLDIGVGIATRRATDGVIVALPGSTQNVQVSNGQQAKPTLTVRQGTSVSVFVARDLDFSDVDG